VAGKKASDVSMVRRSTVVLVVLIGLLGVSNIAVAEHEESHPEDTWFSYGYEPVDHFLAINISPNDVDDCVLANGTLTATYGSVSDGGVYDVDLASHPLCDVSGTVVAGPNGQVNHGQFMKAAKSLFAGKAYGCLVRHLAKSDIGRTDETKVRTDDVVTIDIGVGGNFTFVTVEADCHKDNNDATEKGRPDSPGKSGDAPGRNK
jgi:hypothetical protein